MKTQAQESQESQALQVSMELSRAGVTQFLKQEQSLKQAQSLKQDLGLHDVTPMSTADAEAGAHVWTDRLVMFLRIMAVLSMIKGLYHWAEITGFVGGEAGAFENQTTQWQTATVYFAVIELVAAVGLWLATPWGAVVWLTTVVSLAVVELMFPAIFGGNLFVVFIAFLLLMVYLILAWFSSRERPP